MYSFNLIDQPWIPCIMNDGRQQELNLQETLVKAHEIQEIFAQSPIVTVSLYRLLLAVVYRNFPFKNLNEWEKLWKTKQFSPDTIASYFEKWHDRFDLFHPKWPFYQSPGFVTKNPFSIKKLGWGYTAGNAARWFEHSWEDEETPTPPNLVAQWLVATQSAAPSAGRSETLYTKDAPWATGAVILMQGDNLFETLALNLLHFYEFKFDSPDDLPIWEESHNWKPEDSLNPKGALQYLTWQSRFIYIEPNELVRTCYFAQGRSFPSSWSDDPAYLYYCKDEKEKPSAWRLQEKKAIWRNSHSLFSFSKKSGYRIPTVIRHIASLIAKDVLNKEQLYKLQVIGQLVMSPQPIIKLWRQERLPVPAAYFRENNEPLLEKLKLAIELAEDEKGVGRILNLHLYFLAQLLLVSNPDLRNAETIKKDIRNLIKHFDASTQYWAQLETHFKTLMVNLPEDQEIDEHGDITYGAKVLPAWAATLKKAALDVFASITNSLDESSRTLKAVAKVEEPFKKDINIALSPYLKKAKEQTTS